LKGRESTVESHPALTRESVGRRRERMSSFFSSCVIFPLRSTKCLAISSQFLVSIQPSSRPSSQSCRSGSGYVGGGQWDISERSDVSTHVPMILVWLVVWDRDRRERPRSQDVVAVPGRLWPCARRTWPCYARSGRGFRSSGTARRGAQHGSPHSRCCHGRQGW